MRTEYGKLIYLLQDSQMPDVQQASTPLPERAASTDAPAICFNAF